MCFAQRGQMYHIIIRYKIRIGQKIQPSDY